MRKIIISLVLSFMMAVPAWADFDMGAAALKRGDYSTAFREWRPLAEQGDAKAQNGLGDLFQFGKGIPQYYIEAVRWYQKAAEQGMPDAQFSLGNMYQSGKGVLQNNILAHMWHNLAAAQNFSPASSSRDRLTNMMGDADIAKAQKLAHEWWMAHKIKGPQRSSPRQPSAEKRMSTLLTD